MIASTIYDSAQTLFVRIRNAAGEYLNSVSDGFDALASEDTQVVLDEYPYGDGLSLYTKQLPLPSGGPFIQEIVTDAGEVVAGPGDAFDPALETSVQAIQAVADPLSTIVPGSDPPITRGDLIDRLYIPAYAGPVVALPANSDPSVQYVHFFGRHGDNTAAVASKITARAIEGQVISTSMVGKQVLSASLNAEGYASLVLIRGVEYLVTAPWWGESFVIRVTDDSDSRMITDYIAELGGAVVGTAGVGVANSIRAQDGTVWQVMIVDNGDGTFSTPMVRVA